MSERIEVNPGGTFLDKKPELVKCPHCGSMHAPVDRGLKNWRNLFRKPTWDEILILFILIMVLMASWAYIRDVGICHDTLNNLKEVCAEYSLSLSPNSYSIPNLSNIIISNGTG